MPDFPLWTLAALALGIMVVWVLITGFAMPKSFQFMEEQRLAIMRKRLQARDDAQRDDEED